MVRWDVFSCFHWFLREKCRNVDEKSQAYVGTVYEGEQFGADENENTDLCISEFSGILFLITRIWCCEKRSSIQMNIRISPALIHWLGYWGLPGLGRGLHSVRCSLVDQWFDVEDDWRLFFEESLILDSMFRQNSNLQTAKRVWWKWVSRAVQFNLMSDRDTQGVFSLN